MKKVVVHIDDQALRKAVRQVLLTRPILVVVEAKTAAEVRARTDVTTVVLTDLAGLTTSQFLREIQNADVVPYSAPVIVVTAHGNEHLAVQALRDGATSYVPGHLVAAELLSTLDSVFSVANAHHDRLRIMECVTKWNTEFVLDNDRSLISPLVRYFQESTQRMGLCAHGEELRLGIAMEEALVNSIYHGNLEVPSSLREEDEQSFYAEVEARRVQQPYADRRISVTAEFSRSQARFVITDEGPGFDVKNVPDPTDPANVDRVCGRGLLLMRTFMDEVEYNELGNQVRLVKRRQSGDPS